MTWALVMSGGGSLGAYQVGALKAISRMVEEGKWSAPDSVYGVSVGAINGAKIVMSNRIDFPDAVRALERMWLDLKTSDVHRRHFPFGKLHVLWNGTHVFNTQPLRKLIQREFDPSVVAANGYKFGVGTVSWNSGKYQVIDETHELIEDFIYASSVFPMAFEPIRLDGEWWIDGGVRNAVPLEAALAGGARKVKMILTEPAEMEPVEGDPELLTYGPRIIATMAHEVFNSDFQHLLGRTDAKIEVYRPSGPLNADPFSFEKAQNFRLIERGFEEAGQQIGRAS